MRLAAGSLLTVLLWSTAAAATPPPQAEREPERESEGESEREPEPEPEPERRIRRKWFMPLGGNIGAALYPRQPAADTSFIVGGEVSFVSLGMGRDWAPHPRPILVRRLRRRRRRLRQFTRATERRSGARLPHVRYRRRTADADRQRQRLRRRPLPPVVTALSLITVYGRQGFVPADPHVNRHTEIGLLGKIPIVLD